MNDNDIRHMLTAAIVGELDIYTPQYYGLPDQLGENDDFKEAWNNIQFDFIKHTVDRLMETNDMLDPDSEEWNSLILEASEDFRVHVASVERMSLTVPTYIPYLVRQLAEGPRQMGEAVMKLVIDAFIREPEPQGILERIESRLHAMADHMQVLDRAVNSKA